MAPRAQERSCDVDRLHPAGSEDATKEPEPRCSASVAPVAPSGPLLPTAACSWVIAPALTWSGLAVSPTPTSAVTPVQACDSFVPDPQEPGSTPPVFRT